MTTAQPGLNLEQFCEHVRLTNPFVLDRVAQPALAAELDAEAVHQAQFRQLLGLARTASNQHSGVGVVLWGEAGVGKSHLLSRLARWAHRGEQACFVYLQNLQPGPENLARSLLRVTVSILTQGRQAQFYETPLYRLVQAALQTALQENTQALEPERAYARLLDRLSAQAPAQPAFVDRTIYNVLFRFLRSSSPARIEPDDGVAALAVRWLSGDPLDLAEARQLGLPPQPDRNEAVALADDQHIKLVLVALSQMALFAQQPFLLCFDQVENVEPAQIGALTRFLQAVLDSAPNLLVVTCGIYETLNRWHEERVIHDAAWDRVAQFEIALSRVTPHEGRQIVEARLDHFLTPFLELETVKNQVQKDHLFPLGVAWFDEFLKDKVDVRPRHVIKWARDGWARAQQALEKLGGNRWLVDWASTGVCLGKAEDNSQTIRLTTLDDLIDEKVAAKLAEQKSQRQLDPETLPPDAENLAGLVGALLRQCLNGPRAYSLTTVQQPKPPSSRQRPTYHLTAEQRSGDRTISLGVLFLTTGNATASAACALRRILEDRRPPLRLVLVTDQRRPLQLGAKGREYLAQLRRKYADRFQQIELTFDQYAELDALKATGGMALSHDLEIDLPDGRIRPVSEAEVVASHHRRDRYATHVLLRPILGLSNTESLPTKASTLDEQDVRQFIMAQLALMPGASSYELAVKYVEFLKATNRPPLDVAGCKPLLEGVARGLHQAGLVNVTPSDDGLFLLPRRK
jgi:hypothetical protein